MIAPDRDRYAQQRCRRLQLPALDYAKTVDILLRAERSERAERAEADGGGGGGEVRGEEGEEAVAMRAVNEVAASLPGVQRQFILEETLAALLGVVSVRQVRVRDYY